MNNNSSKQILLSVLGVAILVVAVVGVSFAAFTFTKTDTAENTITTGAITLTYQEGNAIELTDAMPITDAQGKGLSNAKQYLDFQLDAKVAGTTTINYDITASKVAESTLADSDVKLYLESLTGANSPEASAPGTQVMEPTNYNEAGSGDDTTGRPSGEMLLAHGTISKTGTTWYRLRMWVADDATDEFTSSKTFKVKVNVYAKAAEPSA